MVNLYTTDSNKKFIELKKLEKGCWIDLVNPTYEEIEEIAKKTKTDLDLLTKLMDDEELPRIEEGDNATLIVIDTPYITDKAYKHKYNTDPLGIIINNDGYFITISLQKQALLLLFTANINIYSKNTEIRVKKNSFFNDIHKMKKVC